MPVMCLGERIRELRLKNGYKQKELAMLLNIENNTMCQYENSTRIPDYIVIRKICKLFNISADYLLGITNYEVSYLNDEYADLIIKYSKLSNKDKEKVKVFLKEVKLND